MAPSCCPRMDEAAGQSLNTVCWPRDTANHARLWHSGIVTNHSKVRHAQNPPQQQGNVSQYIKIWDGKELSFSRFPFLQKWMENNFCELRLLLPSPMVRPCCGHRSAFAAIGAAVTPSKCHSQLCPVPAVLPLGLGQQEGLDPLGWDRHPHGMGLAAPQHCRAKTGRSHYIKNPTNLRSSEYFIPINLHEIHWRQCVKRKTFCLKTHFCNLLDLYTANAVLISIF